MIYLRYFWSILYFLLFGLNVGIFLLDLNWSFVPSIFFCCFDSWSLWWGESDALQLSPFADVYSVRLLERAPFYCFQILIFQSKRLRLLSFLSWSLTECDFWTSFLEDFHHDYGVNHSSPSRLLWLDLRNPSNFSTDYIVYGRSPYLNFDPTSKPLFNKFLHVVQRSVCRLFVIVGGFLDNVPKFTKGSHVSYFYLYFLQYLVLIIQFIAGFIVRWIIVWSGTGSWWGRRRRISYFPLSPIALFGMFSLLGRGKVITRWTLTPSPTAIFLIFGRVALR